jgi:hypothetical protein
MLRGTDMKSTPLSAGVILTALGLLISTAILIACVAFRNAPIVGAEPRGFQAIVLRHVVLFGLFLVVLALLAFLGQLAKARSWSGSVWLRASACFVAASWFLAGATVDILSLAADDQATAWPPAGVVGGGAVVSLCLSSLLIFLGVRVLRRVCRPEMGS